MARHSLARKRRTREHVIADLGVNFVERQALLCGYSVERRLHDYGIDLVILTYNAKGETEIGEIMIQVKATDRLRTVLDGRFVAITIERAHLRSWIIELYPVILFVYDARNDRAYWLYVQAAFQGVQRFRAVSGSEHLTLRIPTSQLLDPDAVRRFGRFRDAVMAQKRGVIHHHD